MSKLRLLQASHADRVYWCNTVRLVGLQHKSVQYIPFVVFKSFYYNIKSITTGLMEDPATMVSLNILDVCT